MELARILSVYLLLLVLVALGIQAEEPIDDVIKPHSPKTRHFKFRRRTVRGRDVAAVSFRLDPERGRRSILAHEGERYLHTPSLLHHIPSFHGEVDGANKSFPKKKNPAAAEKSPKETHLQRAIRLKEEFEKEVKEVQEEIQSAEVSIQQLTRSAFPETQVAQIRPPHSRMGFPSNRKRRRRKKLNQRHKRRKARKKKLKKERRKKKGKKKKHRPKLIDDEACQYKTLKKCAKKVGIFPWPKNSSESEVCSKRRFFLDCVEKRRARNGCKRNASARGNLTKLRSGIKNTFVTSTSCLLSESLKG